MSIAAAIDAALAETPLPGAVAMAATEDGVIHASAHGAARLNSFHRLFSMTKLVGVVAALRAEEMGALSIDEPVARLLPEFEKLPVLEAGALRPQRTRATLAMLASHTAGPAYADWHAGVRDYCRAQGFSGVDDGSLAGLTSLPLAFDPGAGWAYGTSIDWLGLAVERATGEPLEVFVPREIFAPLGLRNLVFAPDAAQAARLVPAHRLRAGALEPLAMEPRPKSDVYPMGSALWGEAADYLRLLQALLIGGMGILRPESVARLYEPRVTPLAPIQAALPSTEDVDPFPGRRISFAWGGLRADEDMPGRRRAGAVAWAGMQNTHFWLDPAEGVAGVILMQHLPFCSAPAMAVYEAFERAVYAALR